MYISSIDYWGAESAYDFICNYVTDDAFHKAFPALTRQDFLDNPEEFWEEGRGDWEVIRAIVQHWDGYYTMYSDGHEYVVIQLRMPDYLDPNNISHYKRI